MLLTSKIASVLPRAVVSYRESPALLPKLWRTTISHVHASITYLPRLGLLLLLLLLRLRLMLLAWKRRMLLGERRGRRGCHGRPALEVRLLLLELRGLSQERAARTDRRRGRRDGALCRRPCDRRGRLGWRTWRGTALVRAEITVSTGLTGGKQIIL